MNASISKPFLLSSYGLPKRLPKGESSVYVTHNHTSMSSDGHVTVAAQGDGVHLLDLSSLHPVISHTLGPSTTFSCPAVSRNTVEKGAHICTTYAVIASSSDVTPDECGRTVWSWRDNLSASLDKASQQKRSTVVLHAISRIYILEDMEARVLLLSPEGSLTLTDAELNVCGTHGIPNSGSLLIESFVFSRNACSFLPSRTAPPQGIIVILVLRIEEATRIRVLAIYEEEFIELGNTELTVPPDEIFTISCSTSGCVSIVARDGVWYPFLLESTDNNSIHALSFSESVHLTSLSFVSAPKRHRSSNEVSILSLGSSHVLLAGISTSPTPEIVFLLWDLQYSVHLASSSLPIPSTLPYSKESSIRLTLVAANASYVLLALCPASDLPGTESRSHSSTSRSSVLAIPFTAPAMSTIANAMGRAADGMRWLAKDSFLLGPSPAENGPTRGKLLKTMRTSMEQNRPAAASAAFFEWEKSETKDVSQMSGDGDPRAANAGQGKLVLESIDYAFVKQVLDVVLQPAKLTTAPYPSDILRFLLQRDLVSASMIESDLLEVLWLRNDWESVLLALDHVLDIPESDVMSTLKLVISHHRKGQAGSSSEDAMQVDSEIPTLQIFLSSCVAYTMSPAALRLAVHEHLRDGDDLICVLEVMEGWVSACVLNNALSPIEETTSSGDKSLPPLTKSLSFLEALLDACLVSLLQHPPCHRVLRKVLSQLEPELAMIEQMEELRGPLEPFARHAKAAREGVREEPQVDWRKKRRQQHEQTALAIGLYRVEELVL